MRQLKIYFLISPCLLMSCGIFSQTIETDRPDQTESSATVPKRSFQLESGFGLEKTGVGQNDGYYDSFTLPTTLFRLALMKHFELRLVNTLRYQRQLSDSTRQSHVKFDDLELGCKWQLTNGGKLRPRIALLSHVVMPSGSHNSKTYGMVNKVLISHQLTDRLNLGYNIGHIYCGKEKGDMIYTLSLGVSITDKLGVYAENYGSAINFTTLITNMDGGFTYLIKDNIQFDYSFGVGLNNRMNYQAVGISIRFS